MKKLIFVLFFLIMATAAFAQTIHFGVKGGYNIESESVKGFHVVAIVPLNDPGRGAIADDKLIYQSTTGFNVGGFANIDLHHFTLQTTVLYTTKGVKLPQQPVNSYEYPGGLTLPLTVYRLNYLELSFNTLYNINLTPGAAIQLGGGVFKGRGLSAGYTFGGENKSATFTTSQNIPIHFHSTDYGFNFIAGLALNKSIMINWCYSLGLANIATDGASKITNRVMSFSVGYLFGEAKPPGHRKS